MRDLLAVGAVVIDLTPAAAIAEPEKRSILQPLQSVIDDFNPSLGLFAKESARLAVVGPCVHQHVVVTGLGQATSDRDLAIALVRRRGGRGRRRLRAERGGKADRRSETHSGHRVLHSSASLSVQLPRDFFADVLDRFADLATAFAERFFDVAGCSIGLTFVAKTLVVGHLAGFLFHRALGLIDLAAHFILIPHEGSSL